LLSFLQYFSLHISVIIHTSLPPSPCIVLYCSLLSLSHSLWQQLFSESMCNMETYPGEDSTLGLAHTIMDMLYIRSHTQRKHICNTRTHTHTHSQTHTLTHTHTYTHERYTYSFTHTQTYTHTTHERTLTRVHVCT
jgi:hypothetical protein